MLKDSVILKIIVVTVTLAWSSWAAYPFMSAAVNPRRKAHSSKFELKNLESCKIFCRQSSTNCVLDNLRRNAEQFQKQVLGAEAGANAGAAQDDDEDVPELVPGETFEEAAEVKEPEARELQPEEKKEP